ncbi:MAG: hypothetical protein R2877_07980, partial [Bdellovibrionota bacterium]
FDGEGSIDINLYENSYELMSISARLPNGTSYSCSGEECFGVVIDSENYTIEFDHTVLEHTQSDIIKITGVINFPKPVIHGPS